MISLISGLFIGAIIGFGICAILTTAKIADCEIERMRGDMDRWE